MRFFGTALCLIGALVTAVGVVGYFAGEQGWGIAGFVLGLGAAATGVMVFVADFVLHVFRRDARLLVRLGWLGLRIEVRAEMGNPGDSGANARDAHACCAHLTWPGEEWAESGP